MLVDLVVWFGATPDTARYVFIRSAAAALTAFLLGVLVGPWMLALLRRMRLQEHTEKTDSVKLAEMSKDKRHTPTMGGLLLIPSLLIALLLWGNFQNEYVKLGFLGTIGFSLIGAIDDYIKLKYPKRHGMTSLAKLALQSLVSAALAVALWRVMGIRGAVDGGNPLLELSVPFSDIRFDLSVAGGLPFLVLSTLIMVGTSNGVNLADGLDGLAPGSVILAAGAFALIAFAVGRPDYAEYLSIQHVRGAQEMVILASALTGAALAFLWYNAYPAQVFLGDTGSLPLGGLLGYIAIVSKQELVLPIVGGIFVLETLSVMIQVASFKLTGKRVFRIAPIPHHFQFGGLHEAKIVVRFWIVGAFFAMMGIATLRFS